MNSNFNISADDFNFTQKEIEVLFWIKYWSIKKFTPETSKGSESMTTPPILGEPLFMLAGMAVKAAEQSIEKNRISKDYTKDRWCNEWSKVTRKLLNINNKISKSDVLSEFNALNISAGKKLAFIVELSTFSAYFPLNEGDSIYDGLKFNADPYFHEISKLINIDNKELSNCLLKFNEGLKSLTKYSSGPNSTWIWVGVGAAVLLLVAPYLAGVIGGVIGLSGAAATSAGLAFLGGGSLAAGGFGMAGGYVAVMAGGALIGYTSGNSNYQTKVKESTKEEILISSAKMIAVLSLINKPILSIKRICNSTRQLQIDLEADADINFISNRVTEGDDSAKKAAILIAFRRVIRVIK